MSLRWTNAACGLGICGTDDGSAMGLSSSQAMTTKGRVNHAVCYDESLEHVLEELEGAAAEAAYGKARSDEVGSPPSLGAD